MNFKFIYYIILPLSVIFLTACNHIPNMADIVKHKIDYNITIKGCVDFIGMEGPVTSFLWPSQTREALLSFSNTEIDGDRNAISLFISKLDSSLREKIHVAPSYDYCGFLSRFCLFPWRIGHYNQFLFKYQEPVNDDLSLGEACFAPAWKRGGNQGAEMTGIALSQVKKYSDADYFLLIVADALDFMPYDVMYKNKKATVVIITIIYNRTGKKIYSKLYKDSFNEPGYRGKYFLYDCTMKLIENQGEQISKDLSFLLGADNAPAPTLEDLYQRLQQPGTIQEDVKWLKTFPNQKKRRL